MCSMNNAIAIAGFGTMGQSILRLLVKNCENQITIFVRSLENHQDRYDTFWQKLDYLHEKGIYTKPSIHYRKRVTVVDTPEQIPFESNLVIESIVEDLAAKQEFFTRVEKKVSDDTILCSNTSNLDLRSIYSTARIPNRCYGLHFFNPADRIPVAEVGCPENENNHYREKLDSFLSEIKIKPFYLNNSQPGYIVNKLIDAFLNLAVREFRNAKLAPEQFDDLIKSALGHPMGPLKLIDLIGLDVLESNLQDLFECYGESHYLADADLKTLVKKKRIGRKVKKGFFDYD